ncbi:MAG: tryptophan--tRNA ligase [Verrucomicrobiales bacterium]|nr:tryptophan--tRNA ligase [Verrucomicrobiales bacterium]OUU88142.1 MAG: tryptophan--tRNA ligase [Verrucomicrobiaceae bacterium TMED76]RCL30342.1 MAG: tryptophan--tRNA ligase [Verrucomicrobiota bacterium]|tara:strand:+ start:1735 stop:2697 length:963 start_codon:yes stop_codon:yes gene_type:complete
MRILSGIQPSGRLHVGNYFGMMQPSIDLQDQGEAFYFIADYHSLTTVTDPVRLRDNVRDVAIDFLACGLDPDKAVFFKQSDVPEVTELAWLLSTVTPMGFLNRCHSFKDKTDRGLEATHGLFSYPVLMAADILIYESNIVPVGDDQKQHLEVTRDIAIKFNNLYGEVFVVPEPKIRKEKAKVPGIDGQKMSKSYGNIIEIFGTEKQTKKKIMSIVTDSTPVEDPKNPEESIIIDLFNLVGSDKNIAAMKSDFANGGFGYGDFKKRLFADFWDYFQPMREKREQLSEDLNYVDGVLEKGAEKARTAASSTLIKARKACGID